MPYYGYSMETRGRWVKLSDGTFGVKTDGPARRGMVIEVQARSGRIQERRLTQQIGFNLWKTVPAEGPNRYDGMECWDYG